MYRQAFRNSLALRTSARRAWNTQCYKSIQSNTISRGYSTPVQSPDNKQLPPPPTESSPPSPSTSAASGSTSTPLESQRERKPQPQPEVDPTPGEMQTNVDQLNDVKARMKEWSHETIEGMRQRGDEFTARVARTFAQLGKELNRVTGYGEIEVLKRKVVEQESRIYDAREAARQAKEAYDRAVLQRAKSQREVNDLLQRKSHWTDEDVSRFTTLVREDHAREHDEARAKGAAAAAEDAVEREFSELMRVILNRYHEEQAWSDKIRSASTYGSLAALALNMAVFVLAIVLVEPWKRRRLAQTFERKVEEMGAQTAAAFEARTGVLAQRMDEQARVLGAVLETMRVAAQGSPEEADAVGTGSGEERVSYDAAEDARIPAGVDRDRELVWAVTASAAAAGVLGWVARSWFG